MQNLNHIDITAGARNLLLNCAKCRSGERVLLAYEPSSFGYFEDQLVIEVAGVAKSLGLEVDSIDVGFTPNRAQLSEDFLAYADHFDVVVFLARLGDQLRFSQMPDGPRFVVCFANNRQMMASGFGAADYRAFVSLKQAVDRALVGAEQISIRCPAGTQVEGRVIDKSKAPQDTALSRFPMSVFSPVPAIGFSGRVALGGFLTGTGSQYYDGYTIEFEDQVFAHFQSGRLSGFSGTELDVKRANGQYDRVAARFGIDRDYVHSWHCGIHPGCGFPWDIRAKYEQWGGTAFGNPRVLHFHTCGAYAPGEISWNLFDPTIEIDGVSIWENGQFHPERLTDGDEILAQYPCAARAFANPDRNIGLAQAI